MSFLRTTVDKAPKQTRHRVPRFERTKEWAQLRAALEKGLKSTEAVSVIFTDAEMKAYRITNRRTVARYVQKFIKDHKLPYKVRSFSLPGGGFNVLVSRPQK